MFGAAAGGLIGPPVAGKLMEWVNPYLPIGIVVVLSSSVFVTAAFIPETLQRKKVDDNTDSLSKAVKKHVSKSFKELGQSFGLLKNNNIILVMVTFFIQSPLMAAYSTILVQYVSEHFGWTIAQTSYLLSPLGILNLVILAGLPALAEMLMSERTHHRIRLSPFGKDAFLSRLTLVFLILGAIVEFLAGSMAFFIFGLFIGTFGSGLSPLGRALVTHYVDSEHTSRLMSLISMVETIGSFFGGPLLAYWFDIGHQKGEIWTGLPFLYIAFLCAVALVCLLFIREPAKKIRDETESEDEATLPYSDEESFRPEPDAPLP
jgi:MFS transporter, PCFT/HCP family, solute carrier family 46 (folate transporter), member 1